MTAPINTTFTTGTTITSNWLNGVNDAINDATQDITGATARTVVSKLADTISVKDFGAVGDGVTDDATAITNAAAAALEAGKSLFFPSGQYYIASTIEIDNSTYSQWSTLSWVGEEFVTGNALYQNSVSGVEAGSVIVTDGTSAVQITMNNFWNESVRFNNLSFYNKGAIGLTGAIIVEKDSSSYVRGQEFNKLGFYNFDTCVVLRGLNATFNNNYFGPTTIQENFAYECSCGFYLDNGYINLFEMTNSLYHGCSKYGIQITTTAGTAMTVRNTHFEGCEPAAIKAGNYTSIINLDSISAENTGVDSGYGFLKASTSLNNLILNVSNLTYNGNGFALMPDEFRLNRGATINATSPVKASGYGWKTNTPTMVTPVVSNNATYNQTEVSTFALCVLNGNVSNPSVRVFDKFAGYNSGSNTSLTPPNSVNLPDSIRSQFVGVNSGVTLIQNISDSYTAPSNGYIYTSWMGKFTATDNGFNSSSTVLINGSDKLTNGYTFGPYEGNFVLVVPVSSGQTLTIEYLEFYSAATWSTGAYVSFNPSQLNMGEIANGYPKTTTTTYSLATATTLNLVDYTNATTPYSINVKLFFNGGSKGYKEYVITGDGAVAANKVYTSIASSVVAGVAVTTNTGGNSQMYNIDVANTSGATVTVTKQVTYIS